MMTALPDTARLWIYASTTPLSSAQVAQLQDNLTSFLPTWASHGTPVQSAIALQENRFLMVAGHVVDETISGCGMDSLVHAIETARQMAGITWCSALDVLYRDTEGAIEVVSRPAFRQLVKTGTITAETPVFNTALTSLGVLRSEGFEVPAGTSWHARIFRIPTPA